MKNTLRWRLANGGMRTSPTCPSSRWSDSGESVFFFSLTFIPRLCLENTILLRDVEAQEYIEVVSLLVNKLDEQNKLSRETMDELCTMLNTRQTQFGNEGEMEEIESSEASLTLVGTMENISKPLVALVGLSRQINVRKTTEESVAVRFIFVALTPSADMDLDCVEIGRSMSTLMTNNVRPYCIYFPNKTDQDFRKVLCKAEEQRQLTKAMDNFLDEVKSPHNWNGGFILSLIR